MIVDGNEDLIAEELGIDPDELAQLKYVEGESASEDGIIYYYYITFSEGNPPAIMAKIKGLVGLTVQLSPNLFEEPDGDQDLDEDRNVISPLFEVGKRYEFRMIIDGEETRFWRTIAQYQHPMVKFADVESKAVNELLKAKTLHGEIINVTSPNFISATIQD
ncbi:hypothetical protein [Rhodopseudomonas palustris]|uniref:Uncharacterized protein n=1 Tax=Rhodopseudomonas palustris (strain BisB18) TaxID=316056 RepID=Q214U7_RHOPB